MQIEELNQLRDNNFKKLGQYMYQKQYYDEEIKKLLIQQQELCNKIFRLQNEME